MLCSRHTRPSQVGQTLRMRAPSCNTCLYCGSHGSPGWKLTALTGWCRHLLLAFLLCCKCTDVHLFISFKHLPLPQATSHTKWIIDRVGQDSYGNCEAWITVPFSCHKHQVSGYIHSSYHFREALIQMLVPYRHLGKSAYNEMKKTKPNMNCLIHFLNVNINIYL